GGVGIAHRLAPVPDHHRVDRVLPHPLDRRAPPLERLERPLVRVSIGRTVRPLVRVSARRAVRPRVPTDPTGTTGTTGLDNLTHRRRPLRIPGRIVATISRCASSAPPLTAAPGEMRVD